MVLGVPKGLLKYSPKISAGISSPVHVPCISRPVSRENISSLERNINLQFTQPKNVEVAKTMVVKLWQLLY